MMRKINITVCCITVLFILGVLLLLVAGAEIGSWTDSGNYDEAWLGDYENTAAYTVSSDRQLAAFAAAAVSGYSFENKTITLGANIDMSGNYWTAVFAQDKPFLGTFDGQGYIISGIVIKDTSELGGFFAYNGGTVKNLSISITANTASAAALVVYNGGSVLNCASSGQIGSDTAKLAGGIVGENNGTVNNCYSVAQVSCASADNGGLCGGICAKNTSVVADCTWSGSEKGIGEGNEPVNSSAFTDLNTLLSSLNNNAAANGYCAWIHDYTSVFGGYPIMNNACPYVFVTGISFAARELELYPGDEYVMQCTVYPENASNKALVWLTTNEAVAKVDENGNISAVSSGYATIRATTVDGGMVANCSVRVVDGTTVKSESVKLDKTEYRILLGQTSQIMHTITPANVTDKKVTYKVRNEEIVVCDENGLLTPKAPGSTAVTVTAGDGESCITALITVLEETYAPTWDGTVAASFAGGDGSKLNPYVIDTPQQLAKLANDVNAGNSYEGMYFVQRISIRLNDTTFEDWKNKLTVVHPWTPIGTSAAPFKGNYDGAGYSVNGIYIDDTSTAAGLFGYTSGGSVKNVNIKHSIISGGEYCGALVGFNSSKIYKCTFSGSVSGKNYVGALVGYSSEMIDFCSNSGNVIANKNVGGIVGYSDAVITNCANTGNVSGDECVGGICGKTSSVIENCYNNAYISAGSMGGGIVGRTSMNVVNSYCLELPEAMDYVGTIAGYSEKAVSSYAPSGISACGNLDNSDDFLLVALGNTYVTKKGNEQYIEVLNLYRGCIYNGAYFEWVFENDSIVPGAVAKALPSVYDENTGIELSGCEINGNDYYVFEPVEGESVKAALSKINQSSLFEKTKLDVDSVMFITNIGVSSTAAADGYIQNTSYRLTLPLDFTSIREADGTLGEYDVFARAAIVNITSQEMFIYIPEYVTKTTDGTYVGNLRCLSHIITGTSVTNYGEITQRFSFYYSDAKMSFSAMNTGEWAIVELGENENIVAIETGTSEVTLPAATEEPKQFGFSIVLTVIVCVVLVFGGAAIVLIQRSKNNLRVQGESAPDEKNENEQ